MGEKDHHEHGDDIFNSAFIKRKKISLEKYFAVIASGDYNSLTVGELNHILSINCYKKIKLKKQAAEAVTALEMKNFSRSTLGECIQPAPMSLNDVIKDLKQLNWQTCPVVSVRSISSAHCNSMDPTCNPKDTVDPAGLISGKKNKMAGPVSKHKSCDQTGRSDSSGGDKSGDQRNHREVVITNASSSSTVKEKPKAASERKRKMMANQWPKSQEISQSKTSDSASSVGDLNHLISATMSGVTCCLRFPRSTKLRPAEASSESKFPSLLSTFSWLDSLL